MGFRGCFLTRMSISPVFGRVRETFATLSSYMASEAIDDSAFCGLPFPSDAMRGCFCRVPSR